MRERTSDGVPRERPTSGSFRFMTSRSAQAVRAKSNDQGAFQRVRWRLMEKDGGRRR